MKSLRSTVASGLRPAWRAASSATRLGQALADEAARHAGLSLETMSARKSLQSLRPAVQPADGSGVDAAVR
ncbi:hypothetical protein [Hydrogenophaga sp.]|uniref:hypothetical protein n=1 Tax=Hydrogenophaga sp. TaxID=1904254 RepID=UPI003D295D1C